jgi:hypothetical protein
MITTSFEEAIKYPYLDAYVLAADYLSDSTHAEELDEYLAYVLKGLCPNKIQPVMVALKDSLLGYYLGALFTLEDVSESIAPDWDNLNTVGSMLSWKPVVAGLDAKYAGYSTVDNPIITQD